jgi:hypothetical protein
LPLLRIVLKNNFEMGAKMASELNLALEEIQFFVADAELAKKIYNKAAEITAERIRSSISGRKQFSLFEFT